MFNVLRVKADSEVCDGCCVVSMTWDVIVALESCTIVGVFELLPPLSITTFAAEMSIALKR